MEKLEISRSDVQIGDNLEMVFNTVGWAWIQAVQLAAIESKLSEDKRFNIHSIRVDEDDPEQTKVVYRITVNPPPDNTDPAIYQAGIGVAIVAAIAAVGGGLFLWLSLDKVYKITESPAGQMSLGLIAVAILLYVLKALK